MAGFSIETTPGGVGAFVNGINIAKDVNGNVAGELKNALGDHGVLFFRDQDISRKTTSLLPSSSATSM